MKLLDHFSELTIYPENAKKLRELVLQLAVQGKLTESWRANHPEPASPAGGLVSGYNSGQALLEKITAEKAKLIQEGKIKKEKPLPTITDNEMPYELPDGWVWCRMGNLFELTMGQAPPGNACNKDGNGLVFVKVGQFGKFFPRVDEWTTKPHKIVSSNHILICVVGATIGKLNYGIDCAIGRSVAGLLPYNGLDKHFLFNFLKTWTEKFRIKSRGSAQGVINKNDLKHVAFPLPPLEEQKAIVAKVDVLMKEIDALEQLSVKRIEQKNKFVASVLHHISTTSLQEMNGHWDLLKSNFHHTIDEVDIVKKLRETILQLAVQGKLTQSFRTRHPELVSGSASASALLEMIKTEKAQLIQEGKIKKEKPLPPITEDEIPYELPDSWVWCKMQDLCPNISSGSTPPKQFFTDLGIPYLKVYNIRNQLIDFGYKEQFVDPEYHRTKLKRSILEPGDVIMNIVGPPLGKIAIIPDTHDEWNCNQAIAFFKPFDKSINIWLYTFLCAGIFLDDIELIGTAGQDNISVTKSKNIKVPLPPLLEQKAIVEKVNQLMSLSDQLEQHISVSQRLAVDLMKSLVREVI
jgi:type I restriction enzyme S subunit